ncbi:high mobility group A [Hibiscus trionum]|uniref:HMG-Y-related protein A n=1 Tax=Hibiscus trionum TaxID=183268 RepID=A0A9W7H0P1_HIBTR|nr:high mobility group A [Hibiscus trionum]
MATEEVNKPPPLPSYPQLIIDVIEALNDKNGSNKTTISKYIESKYGDLSGGHSTLLTHHLNKMKETGELVFWKNNYMKADPNAPPRRGRGRPPKPKVSLPPGMVLSSGRPRGRPPKDPNAPSRSPKPRLPSESGRPRGRPRKMARPEGGIGGSSTAMTSTSVRPRGRPPKVKAPALTEVSVGH